MKKNYIKMNDNDNYLSLGNVINAIKKVSINKNTALQSEIFASLFNVNNYNMTAINNYCIGIRALPMECKKIYIDLNEKYRDDKEIYINIILSIMNILDDKIYIRNKETIELINNNQKLTEVCNILYNIASNDEHIKKSFLVKTNNYEDIIKYLNYAILINIQPVYLKKINIKINRNELNEYLNVKMFWGQSYITSLIELARKNNVYACAELGSLEYDGLVSGKRNYKKSYEYYLKAANKDHPKGCWMVANLMLSNKVKYNFETMWSYLNKAVSLGSAAAYNTLGLCYLSGNNEEKKINYEKAKYYFNIASDFGYAYAFNNLGKICEDEGEFEQAIGYYKVSADMNESWALNKVGEYYRKKGDLKTAYFYYLKSIECPIFERTYYGYYNLAKYYYENGCEEANIPKNETLAKSYYKIFYDEKDKK